MSITKSVSWLTLVKTSIPFLLSLIFGALLIIGVIYVRNRERTYRMRVSALETNRFSLEERLGEAQKELDTLKSVDQKVRNDALEEEISRIQTTYKDTVSTYDKLLKLREQTTKTGTIDQLFSQTLWYLSKNNYASASVTLKTLSGEMTKLTDTINASFVIPANVPASNAPPAAGFARQNVQTDAGNFLVDIVSADLSSTRVIVDTASDKDCRNDCPVLPLGDYVGRNGGFAGINGSYFCPASYPSCQDKKNSFDTLLMNKNKVYLNSDNNVYSTVPAVIFLGGSVRFVGQSLAWGRDTGVDGVLANQPLLVSGGNVVFGGDGDPKKGSKGPRSFVGNKGNTIYIGVVHNATVAEGAIVLKALGMENALNLDSGGSTALWYGGYKVGPGRAIPNAIVFVRK